MSKVNRYEVLTASRKSCSLCEDQLVNASQIDGGKYDTDRIGAYSNWQGNLDSPIVLVAQDFADVNGFRQLNGWAGHRVGTNLTLIKLFESVGITLAVPEFGVPGDVVFFTNAVLCMKKGVEGKRRMQQSLPAACFKNCRPFLRRTIDMVSPRIVLGLGAKAIRSVLGCYQIKMKVKMADMAGKPILLSDNCVLVPLYHPSRTVLNTHRSFEKMKKDWSVISEILRW